MAFLKHDKNNMVVGLSWNQLTQKSANAEAVNLSEHESCPYGVIHKLKNEDGVSNFLGLTSNSSDSGKISAAIVFSTIVENGMIIDKLSEKQAWWCASLNNQILTQTDKVYDLDDITNQEHELIQFIDEALPEIVQSEESGFVIYAHPDIAELIQDLVGEITVVSMGLTDLISDSDVKFPGDFNKQKIKKIGGTHPLVIAAIGAVAIGSCYYFFLYDPAPEQVDMDMSGLSSLKEPSKRVTEVVKEVPPSEKDKEILAEAMDQEKKWLEYDLARFRLDTIAQKVIDTYEIMPLMAGGWKLRSLDYRKSVSEDLIRVEWRKDFGTADDFKKYWESSDLEIFFGLDGNRAVLEVPIENNGVNTDAYAEKYEEFRDSEYTYDNLMSALDRKGFEWTMNMVPEEARKEPIEGLFNKDIAELPQIKILKYGVEISGKSGKYGFNSVLNLSEETDLLTATLVEINVEKGFDWTIKGELYDVK